MNLHSIKFRLLNVAIWLHANGRNGRDIGAGDHLWVLPEGEPPNTPYARQNWQYQHSWLPPRFSWSPFQYSDIFRNGWVAPLCGQRTASRNPRVGTGWGTGYECQPCITAAQRAGIVPLTYSQAREQSSIRAALDIEQQAWVDAGRPSPWPSPSETPAS